jgi:fumarate reductase subunit C
MMRELSSLFIGAVAILLIFGLYRLSQGPVAFDAFVAALLGQGGTAFVVVTLFFSAYHTYTWFQVTPKAMPIALGGKRLPGFVIVAAHWLGFVVLSAGLWMLAVAA